jgi:myosin-5
MAENIYSKGTRVWFEDRDQAWISAEVLSASKGTGDAIRLVFIDERGKVVFLLSGLLLVTLTATFSFRRLL